jgi:uncharacterized protein
MADDEYLNSILKWREEMDANLRRENDWLAAAGLFWLKKGFNTFGSSRDCDIRFPKPMPLLLGAFEFDGTTVTLGLSIGQSAEVNSQTIQSSTVLKDDLEDSPSFVKFGDLCVVVVRRAERIGIRLWDNSRPQRRDFPPRVWFPADEKFLVPALFTPYPIPTKVKMPNVFGEMEDNYLQGYVLFRLDRKSYQLHATELEDGCLYVQFKDLTSEKNTYPYGRYLYTEAMKDDGQVLLDFNKAYNPPSAFTQYAICNFAPKINRLKGPIEAGEMYPRNNQEKK